MVEQPVESQAISAEGTPFLEKMIKCQSASHMAPQQTTHTLGRYR